MLQSILFCSKPDCPQFAEAKLTGGTFSNQQHLFLFLYLLFICSLIKDRFQYPGGLTAIQVCGLYHIANLTSCNETAAIKNHESWVRKHL